jgi:hypothetical protein
MQLFSWLHKRMTHRGSIRPTSACRPSPRFRPRLEALEDRNLPSFSAPVVYPVYNTQALAAADVNGDGKTDLVTLFDNGVNVGVWLNNGSGTFSLTSEPFTGATSYTGTALGLGVNSSGQLQAVVADTPAGNDPTNPPIPDAISWMANSNGSFTPVATTAYVYVPNTTTPLIPTNATITSLALAPLYGDGTLNVAAETSDGTVYVLHSNGTGDFMGAAETIGNATFASGTGPGQLVIGDFNGDGRPDIVALQNGSVNVFLNNGNGAFAPAQSYTVGGAPAAVAVGDVNGDGKLDIVTANSNGTASILANNGNGTFASAVNYAIGGPATSVAVGDFNQDGHLDIATTGAELDVLLNNGNGTFGAYRDVGPGGSNLVAADFNGDGYPDLAEIAGSALGSGSIDVLFNNPHGSLTAGGFPSSTTAGVAHGFTVTALNADGSVNTGYIGSVRLSSTDPHAVLPVSYTFTAADHGVHTFPVTLETAGTQSISVTDAANGSLVGSEAGIAVTPAAPAALVFSGLSGAMAGTATGVTLTAEDAYGNVATSYTGTVHFSSSDPQAVLPANFTFTSDFAGQASFSVTFKTAGTQTLTASDSAASGLSVTAGGILITPAAPAHLLVSAPASVSSKAKFSLTTTMEDAYGNIETGAGNVIYFTTLHFTSSDSTATLPRDYSFATVGAQVHTFSLVLRKKGPQTITITVPGYPSLTTTISIDVV